MVHNTAWQQDILIDRRPNYVCRPNPNSASRFETLVSLVGQGMAADGPGVTPSHFAPRGPVATRPGPMQNFICVRGSGHIVVVVLIIQGQERGSAAICNADPKIRS